ncbi:MAG: nitroreductase, partial [Actinomycetes bacterium]
MSGTRLSAAEQRALVTAAVAAPSVHNTQPWLFGVHDDHLDLWADPSRQLLSQDPDARALTVSCGAALLNLRVAAEHLGYQPRVELLPDDETPDLLARVAFDGRSAHAGMAAALFEAIDKRHTNRLPYEDRPVPRSVLDALVEAASQEGADLHAISDRQDRRRLVEIIHEADLEQEIDRDRLEEAAHWAGVGSDRSDGVPEESLGPL